MTKKIAIQLLKECVNCEFSKSENLRVLKNENKKLREIVTEQLLYIYDLEKRRKR